MQSVLLGDIAHVQTGPFGSQLHASDYSVNGIPVVMPCNIGENRIIEEGIARTSDANVERLSRHRLETGDIVYSRRGDIERRALVRETETGWLCGTGCLLVRPDNSRVDPEWLSFWLGTPDSRAFLVRNSVGATMMNLNTGILQSVPVRLPVLGQQRQIASILSSLDDKIELNRRMNETLEEMARTIFRSWFVDFDPVRVKARGGDPVEELGISPEIAALFPDSLQDSELGEIPRGWECKELRDCLELAYGKALRAEERKPGDVPVFGSNGIIGNHTQPLTLGPSVIVGRKGNPGFVKWSSVPCFVIDTAFYVVDKIGLEMSFWRFSLEEENLQQYGGDSAVPGLSRAIVYKNQVCIPTRKLLEVWAPIFNSFQAQIDANIEQIACLEETRDYLLPKLLSGEVMAKGELVRELTGVRN